MTEHIIMQINPKISRLACLLTLLVYTQLGFSQTNVIQDYILYKNYPYVVSMTTDGEILEFIRTAPEVMKGNLAADAVPPMPLGPYTKPQSTIAEYISPLNTTTIGDIEVVDAEMIPKTGSTIVSSTAEKVGQNQMSDGKPVVGDKPATDARTMKTTVIRTDRQEVEKPTVIKRTAADDVVNNNVYDLKFQGFTARLTPVLINQIKKISVAHKESPDKFIEIRSFVTAGDDTNKKLAENRMRACKDLLETYGVPAAKIDTGIRPYNNANAGQVSIEFVEKSDGE